MAITTVLINNVRYTAECTGGTADVTWNNRRVRCIRMAETYETMQQLFPAGGMVEWATINAQQKAVPRVDEDGNQILDSDGQPVYDTVAEEYTTVMSDWPLCGPITDNRDGTYTVKMGQRLSREVQAELDEANKKLENAVTAEELTAAYAEGVNSL